MPDLSSIPNNVNLESDRRLQRALEQWQPNFLQWWNEVGPDGFQSHQVYLRTAIWFVSIVGIAMIFWQVL